ncbi:AMIN domain-containing protein, partial [Streptococcus pyogenes]
RKSCLKWTAATLALVLSSLTTPQSLSAQEKGHTTDIRLERAEGQETRLVVGFTAAPTFTARLDRARARLVVDVPNAELRGVPT